MISEPNRISFEVNQTKLIPNRIRGFLKKTKTENEIKNIFRTSLVMMKIITTACLHQPSILILQ